MAQVGGESTYQFLNLVSSPRQAALGGKVLTNVDYGVAQGFYNPPTINPEMDNQLALNYTSYLGVISYGTASYAYIVNRHIQTFHAGITYINYGSFDGYDKNESLPVQNPARVTTDLSGNQTPEKVGFLGKVIRHIILGVELFPERKFNIRLGYNFRRAEELRIVNQHNVA